MPDGKPKGPVGRPSIGRRPPGRGSESHTFVPLVLVPKNPGGIGGASNVVGPGGSGKVSELDSKRSNPGGIVRGSTAKAKLDELKTRLIIKIMEM